MIKSLKSNGIKRALSLVLVFILCLSQLSMGMTVHAENILQDAQITSDSEKQQENDVYTVKADVTAYKEEVNKASESSALLDSLTVEINGKEYETSPVFDKNTENYLIYCPKTIVTYGPYKKNPAAALILPIAENTNAKICGVSSEETQLELGENNFQINVTSQDETQIKTYNIKIIAVENRTKYQSIVIGEDIKTVMQKDETFGNAYLRFGNGENSENWKINSVSGDEAYVTAQNKGITYEQLSSAEKAMVKNDAITAEGTAALDLSRIKMLMPNFATENAKKSGGEDDEELESIYSIGGSNNSFIYKPAIKDDKYDGFAVTNMEGNELAYGLVSSGENFSFKYSNAVSGENEYVSVMLVDDNGVVKNYSRMKKISSGDDESGEVSIAFSKTSNAFEGKMYIFAEQYNGSDAPDLCGEFIIIPFKLNALDNDASIESIKLPEGISTEPELPSEPIGSSGKKYYFEVPNSMLQLPITVKTTNNTSVLKLNDVEVSNNEEHKATLNEGLNTLVYSSRAQNGSSSVSLTFYVRRLATELAAPAISLDKSVLKGYTADGYANVYMGKYDNTFDGQDNPMPIKWNILDTTSNDGSTPAYFVFADKTYVDPRDTHSSDAPFDPEFGADNKQEEGTNEWATSYHREWMQKIFDKGFTAKEKASVLGTSKEKSDDVLTVFGRNAILADCGLNGEKLFALSALEAINTKYGFDNDSVSESYNRLPSDSESYYLRSPHPEDLEKIGTVNGNGCVSTWMLCWTSGRPAMNIDSSKVLFASKAEDSKASADGMGFMTKVQNADGNSDWKLTLKDDNRNFAVTQTTVEGKYMDKIVLNYTGALCGENEYISAIIANSSGEALYYGRVKKVENATDENGTIELAIPNMASGQYTLKVFSEQYNGDIETDYASGFCDIALKVNEFILPQGHTLVHFNSMGGSPVADAVVKIPSAVSEPKEPTKNGYSFAGWYKDSTCKNKFDFKSAIWSETTLYARWVKPDFYAEKAGTYTVPVTLDSLGADKACFVNVSNGTNDIKTVYENGSITFTVPQKGGYQFTKGAYLEDETLNSKLSESALKSGVYMGDGSLDNPYRLMGNILNKIENDNFGLMWKIPSTWAGYETDGVHESSDIKNESLIKSVIFEDRDFATGKLLASIKLDGSRRERITLAAKYPMPLGMYIEPTEAQVISWLANNELYNYTGTYEGFGNSEDRETALKESAVKAVNSPDEILILQTCQRENFGPYTYKIEVEDKFGFKPGQAVNLTYMGGTGGNTFACDHPRPALASRLQEEFGKWEIYYDKNYIVDAEGYISFDLYNSGMFKLSKTDKSATEYVDVVFNTDGGSVVESQRVSKNGLVEMPKVPTKSGHIFENWYKDEEKSILWNFDTDKVTKDTVIYAKFRQTAANFMVTLKKIGSDSVIDTLTIDNSAKIPQLQNPSAEKEILMGWYTDDEHKNKWNFESDIVTEDLTLYAWVTQATFDNLTAGICELEVPNITEAVLVKLTNGTDEVIAVTVDEKIKVNIPKNGNYAHEILGTVAEKTLVGANSIAFPKSEYIGKGTSGDPRRVLADLMNDNSGFNINWALPANWAGYSGGGGNNETNKEYNENLIQNVVFETRDAKTGRLIVSENLDGTVDKSAENARQRIPVALKRPFNINFKINPTDSQIDNWLDRNELYSYTDTAISEVYGTSHKRASELKVKAKTVVDSDKKALMMFDDCREFFGPINFKLDALKYGFEKGEKVYICYMGGTGGGSYHVEAGKPSLTDRLAYEMTWGDMNTKSAVVDENGYIDFSLYSAGMFSLSNEEPKAEPFKAAFITDGGNSISPVRVNEEGKIVKPTDPSKSGYTFDGWYISKDFKTEFDFKTVLTNDIILYAKWTKDSGGSTGGNTGGDPLPSKKTYTVSFEVGKTISGGAGATIPSQTVKDNECAKNPEDDSKLCPFGFYDRGDGYLVLDWYKDRALTKKFSFSDKITENTMLYPEYMRYILKDDGTSESGKGTKSNPYCVQLADSPQSKIAWKLLNLFADGKYDGWWQVYVNEDNKSSGSMKYAYRFDSTKFEKCNIAVPYYLGMELDKKGSSVELSLYNHVAWHTSDKVYLDVDVSDYIKEGSKVEISYKSGSCDGKAPHSNVLTGEWVKSGNLPSEYYTTGTSTVNNGFITIELTHGGTYILKSDGIKGSDSQTTTTGTSTTVSETVDAENSILLSKLNSLIKEGKELVVKSDVGTLQFSNEALTAIEDQTTGSIKVELKKINESTLSENQKKAVNGRPVYSLAVNSNGKTISDFKKGEVKVTLPYTLAKEENSEGLVVLYINDKGSIEKIDCDYDAKTKSVEFNTNHFSLYAIGYDESLIWNNPYSDVKKGDWFYDTVSYVSKSGIMNGTSKTQFAPNGTASRAMLVSILYRIEKSPKVSSQVTFKDVATGKWYTDAICWAESNDIISGYSKDSFGVNDPVTREQTATILMRYAKLKGKNISADGKLDGFKDVKAVSAYAEDSMKWAVSSKLIGGTDDNKLNPTGLATRAQIATIFQRYLENLAK